jgi:hypothetical protein
VISLSEVVMCSIMFVTLQHGVIQVIFSVLAIAFVMDVDDKFQSVLVRSAAPVYMVYTHTSFHTIARARTHTDTPTHTQTHTS